MTATAIRLIAVREIHARWIMWPVALVLALVAVAVPRMVSELDQPQVADAIWLSAWMVPFGISVIVGTTLLGGERGEGRLAFYFARPIATWQIVAGKLAGGVVLAMVAQMIFVVLAGLALPGATRFGTMGVPAVLASLAGVPFGLAAGIAGRARTRWLVLDIAGLVAIPGMFAAVALQPVIGRRYLAKGWMFRDAMDQVYARAEALAIAGLAVALLALVVGIARAVAVGRTEVARSHGVLSRTFWAIALPGCAIVALVASAIDT